MKRCSMCFVIGFAVATILIASTAWFCRNEILNLLTIAYERVDKPVILVTSFRLLQNGKEVGELEKGTVVFLEGRLKDAPIEHFSVRVIWETRGVERSRVYELVRGKDLPLLEMLPILEPR